MRVFQNSLSLTGHLHKYNLMYFGDFFHLVPLCSVHEVSNRLRPRNALKIRAIRAARLLFVLFFLSSGNVSRKSMIL